MAQQNKKSFDYEILKDFYNEEMNLDEFTAKHFKGSSSQMRRWREGENSTGKVLFRKNKKSTSLPSYEKWLKELEQNAKIYWAKNKDAPNDKIMRLLISKYGEKISSDICSAWTVISHDKNLAEFLKKEY